MQKDAVIYKQAAIEALVKAIREDPYYDSNEAINGLGICDVRVILNDLPSAQPEQRWMPVDLQNNSPEENKAVLLGVRFRDDFKHFVTSRQDYNYWTGLGREIKGELRWQPLPEPYRAERRTDD